MRFIATMSCALLFPAFAFAAPGAEALSASGEQSFLDAGSAALNAVKKFVPAPSIFGVLPDFPQNILQAPTVRPLAPSENAGPVLGRFQLADQLDKHRDLFDLQLGPSHWNVSVAGDPTYDKYFITFHQGDRLTIAPVGDPNRLRKEGIDVTVEPGVTYHVHVSIDIFNPVRGSTMEIYPIGRTQGPSYEVKTGDILDGIKSVAYVFNAGGNEYWTLFGTDVDPKTNTMGKTHSFLFFHEDGMSSKGWPLAESAVPVGQATSVTLGDQRVVLERGADGALVIRGNR